MQERRRVRENCIPFLRTVQTLLHKLSTMNCTTTKSQFKCTSPRKSSLSLITAGFQTESNDCQTQLVRQ